LGVAPERIFIERFVLPVPEPEPAVGGGAASATQTLVIRLEGKETTFPYVAGDTILEATRRAGLNAPFSCEQGNCATCMAHLAEGTAEMRVNNALEPDEVDGGWVLTCQARPTAPKVVVDYDA
jgi:ferredoxin